MRERLFQTCVLFERFHEIDGKLSENVEVTLNMVILYPAFILVKLHI